MTAAVGVQVVASPRLLRDAVAQSLLGDGIEMSDSEDSLIAVVTASHLDDVHSKIVIVLGETTAGDVQIFVNGIRIEDRELDATQLHRLVVELAQQVTHDETTLSAPQTPMPPAAETIDEPRL